MDWMSQCITEMRDTPASCYLDFHKMLFQELGVCCFTDANNASLEDFETLIQLFSKCSFPIITSKTFEFCFHARFPYNNCQTLKAASLNKIVQIQCSLLSPHVSFCSCFLFFLAIQDPVDFHILQLIAAYHPSSKI